MEDNPFRLPPDDQIFLIREQEQKKKQQERERVKTLAVWQKTTASSRVNRGRRVDDGVDDALLMEQAAAKTRSMRAESVGVGRNTRREKENVSDFVQKKREMFLVQMSLDVKKAEILKLKEKAKQKNEALNKSEQMLDEDVTRFDAFLHSKDQKAHKAMKDAEDMTKMKSDRQQRIKHLRSQLSAIQSETAKHREAKDECVKFKEFLVKLTPPEWKKQKQEEKLQRKMARKQEWVDKRMTDINAQMQAEIQAEMELLEEREKEAAKGRRRARREAEEEASKREKELDQLRRRIRRKYPTQEFVESEYQEVSSGEEMPLFFEDPKQLLDVLTALEESNLSWIQNSQDTEQALEELDQKFHEMRRTSDAKTSKMKQQISQLERQIADERMKCEELRQQISQKNSASEQEELLAEMAERVSEVHAACDTSADSHDPDTLQMLAFIEAKLEEYLSELEDAEKKGFEKQVESLELAKYKQRRAFVRKLKKDQLERKNLLRLKIASQRSQAPIHEKVGKQIMFRSAPLFQEKRVVQEDDGFEQAVKEHEVFGIWLNKDGLPNVNQPIRPS